MPSQLDKRLTSVPPAFYIIIAFHPSAAADMNEPQTLIDKLWSAHEIVRREDGESLLWVDRHYVKLLPTVTPPKMTYDVSYSEKTPSSAGFAFRAKETPFDSEFS